MAWPLPGSMTKAFGWKPAAPADRVHPADLDPVLLKLFPASAAVSGQLLESLAAVYTAHNLAVTHLAAAKTFAVAIRQVLLSDLSTLYASSPHLPQALAAGYRLLDTLLGDLHRHADPAATVVTSPPVRSRDGFALLPKTFLPAEPAQERLLALVDPAASPPSRPVWQQPRLVITGPLAASPKPGEFEHASLRPGKPLDQPRLAALFPRVVWPTQPAGSVVAQGTSGEAIILGAAAWTAEGALSLAMAPGSAAGSLASRLIAETVAQALAGGLSQLCSTHPLPPGDPLLAPLRAAGFVVGEESTLWHFDFSTDRVRAALLKPRRSHNLALHPARATDVDFWRQRPEAARLLPAEPEFDPDLSWAATREGVMAGLILVRRLERTVVIELLAAAAAARAASTAAALLAQALQAARTAGFTAAIFSIDSSRAPAARLALRCGARVLQTGVRISFYLR